MNKTTANGFLHSDGRHFVDGNGNPIQLRGVALGNWLLQEGYMWGFMTKRLNRERHIEQTVRNLCGATYAETFFPRYRSVFITESDIAQIAKEGFNSVRVPFNSRHFLEDEPGIRFKEEGFQLLDQLIGWCRKYGIYAILDMHGAPGGQTGTNIDDGIDDVPRLFIDGHNWEKALALWETLALRYRDDTAVGGYDLLNEPLHTERSDTLIENVDYLIPSLARFYDDCVRRIRSVDPNHMLSIEGEHWSRGTQIFDHKYDDNMCIHFHAYWTLPHDEMLKPYLDLSEKFNVPLWLGESGENTLEWFTTMFPLMDEYEISWNFWEWKKGIRRNSPCVVKWPEGWQSVVDFVLGGPHPGYEQATDMFEQWLYNSRFENCIYVPEVVHALLRRPCVTIPAISYMSTAHSVGIRQSRDFRPMDGLRHIVRFGSAPEIDKSRLHSQSDVRTDHPWHLYDLLLEEGEYASWMLHPQGKSINVTINGRALCAKSFVQVELCGDTQTQPCLISVTDQAFPYLTFASEDTQTELRITCVKGACALKEIQIDT